MTFGTLWVIWFCCDLASVSNTPVQGRLLTEGPAYLHTDDHMCISSRYKVFPASRTRQKKTALSVDQGKPGFPKEDLGH